MAIVIKNKARFSVFLGCVLASSVFSSWFIGSHFSGTNKQEKKTAAADITARNEANETADFTPGETLDWSLDRSSLDKSTYGLPKVLHKNGLNIVFISDKFGSRSDFLSAVGFLKQSLETVEPWKSYDGFNFFSVYSGKNSFCRVETENVRKPTLKCDEGINNEILPLRLYRFKAIVVSREDFTAWANLTRINNSMVAFSLPSGGEGQDFYRKVLLHEFAHGFGLRDEMTKSVIALAGSEATRAGGPNCAPDVKTALSWWGDFVKKTANGEYVFGNEENDVGFYYGCAGNENYLKPTAGSIMNLQDSTHPSEDYGAVSSDYLNKVLKYCFSDTVYRKSDDASFFDLYPEFKSCVKSE